MLLLLSGLSDSAIAEPFYGVGVRVIDGDSYQLTARGKTIEIRLYGIDCPEYLQPFSQAARLFAEDKILHKNVKITPYYFDSYGRIVAEVQYGDRVLNSDLVEAGLAWVYPRYCKKEMCKSWKFHEGMARQSRRGLWQKSDPIAPWIWKRRKNK